MFGNNKIMKQELTDGMHLSVKDIFYTIQGEGPFAGEPSVFVRLAGCNLRCTFCDTDFEVGSAPLSLQSIISTIQDSFPYSGDSFNRLVVITGGEPLRQNVVPLIAAILNNGDRVQIETAGTVWPDGLEDFMYETPFAGAVTIVVSPKTASVHKNIFKYADAWKYVVSARDGAEKGIPITNTQPTRYLAKKLASPPPSRVPNLVWMSPKDEYDAVKNKENMEEAVRRCLKYGYRLSLQQHKIIGVP